MCPFVFASPLIEVIAICAGVVLGLQSYDTLFAWTRKAVIILPLLDGRPDLHYC
jgi:hypothetical protein